VTAAREVFILHKAAESTVLALRAVRQAKAAAVTRAASAVDNKVQQGNKTAPRRPMERRVAVDVERCAWWAVAVEGSSSSSGGSYERNSNRQIVGRNRGAGQQWLSGYTSKGLDRGANNDSAHNESSWLCRGVHAWREGSSGEQLVDLAVPEEQPQEALLAAVTPEGMQQRV
jgi:hypothetical protein